jgi:hypothetical protein
MPVSCVVGLGRRLGRGVAGYPVLSEVRRKLDGVGEEAVKRKTVARARKRAVMGSHEHDRRVVGQACGLEASW